MIEIGDSESLTDEDEDAGQADDEDDRRISIAYEKQYALEEYVFEASSEEDEGQDDA